MRGLNKVLKAKDKKQKDLAKHLNVSPATISRFCTGEMTMSINQIMNTSVFLDVLLIDLIDMIRVELSLPVKDDPYNRVPASVLNTEYEEYINNFSERLAENHSKPLLGRYKRRHRGIGAGVVKTSQKLAKEGLR